MVYPFFGTGIGSFLDRSHWRRVTSQAACGRPSERNAVQSYVVTDGLNEAIDEISLQDVLIVYFSATKRLGDQGLRKLRWRHSPSLSVSH